MCTVSLEMRVARQKQPYILNHWRLRAYITSIGTPITIKGRL